MVPNYPSVGWVEKVSGILAYTWTFREMISTCLIWVSEEVKRRKRFESSTPLPSFSSRSNSYRGKRNKEGKTFFAWLVKKHQWWDKSCTAKVRFGSIQRWWTQHNLWGPVQKLKKKKWQGKKCYYRYCKSFFYLHVPSLLPCFLSPATYHEAFYFLFNAIVPEQKDTHRANADPHRCLKPCHLTQHKYKLPVTEFYLLQVAGPM